jgi:putative addiction module component (TIGR02574 family)
MAPSLRDLGLDQLSPEDRLAIAEALWDSVRREAVASPLTSAQRAELERRLADSIVRPEAVVSWEEVKARALARARQ